MKEIPLTQGRVAQVSDHRFIYLSQWVWCAVFTGQEWIAMRGEGPTLPQKHIYMHRLIMEVTDPKTLVLHRDGNGLNNQDENLVTATRSEKNHNSRKVINITGYIGVAVANGKYRVRIKGQHLGVFFDPVEAACVYDEAARKYFGEFARTNF